MPYLIAMTKTSKKKEKFNSSHGANTNPFEVHINHSKHKILGQKTKDDRGLPGISRTKAFKKRERILKTEFKNRFKSNQFKDKRIGENNAFMDPEKKMIKRMIAAEKKKKTLYNLKDDEELLHGGKSLNESSMKDKSTFSDEDDDDDLLDANFVKDQHFGGDLFTKSKVEKDGETSNSASKSKKEWIEEIIAESKKKKAETKMEKDIHLKAVAKLNESYLSFLQAMKGRTMTDEEKQQKKITSAFRDYDLLVGEFSVDRSKRAQPADRLKTEEEIAKEDRERLQKLEEERIRRMNGEENKNLSNQKSADALDDGFTYFVKKPLTLEDMKNVHGNLNKKQTFKSEKEDIPNKSHGSENDEYVEEEEESNESEEEDSEGEEVEEESEGEEVEEEENEDEVSKEEELHDESSEEEEIEEGTILDSENVKQSEKNEEPNSLIEENKKKKTDVKLISPDKHSNFDELPFTFEVPEEYEDFSNLLENRMPSEVFIIIERMIKCNHPKLGANNKTKANKIFNYLLQVIQNICCIEPDNFRSNCRPFSYISSLIPHLYTLTQLNPNDCSSTLIEVLDEKYEEYTSQNIKKYPYFDTLVYLKIAGLLFPASDLYHVVMTRVLTFLAQILNQSKVSCGRDIIALLFTSGILIEYLSQSKRFLGEVTNALNGIIYLSLSKRNRKNNLPVIPPFKSFGPFSELLVISENSQRHEKDLPQLKLSLINEEICIDGKWKIKLISEALIQLNKISKIWENLPSVRSIFLPTAALVEQLPVQFYPASLCNLIERLKQSIKNLPKQVPHLKKEDTVVKKLKMLDPSIEDINFDFKKRGSKVDIWQHRYKREKKGVKRELKRDAQFLARLQLEEVLEEDAKRKRKVNLHMQELGYQEHEFKKSKCTK